MYVDETLAISYESRTLTPAVRNYSNQEKEALTVAWACEKFHIYLNINCVDFELVTDHKLLEILYGRKSQPNARIEQWLLKLMAFNLKYLPEYQNILIVRLGRQMQIHTTLKLRRDIIVGTK